jgi:hypothetical protein
LSSSFLKKPRFTSYSDRLSLFIFLRCFSMPSIKVSGRKHGWRRLEAGMVRLDSTVSPAGYTPSHDADIAYFRGRADPFHTQFEAKPLLKTDRKPLCPTSHISETP